MICMPRGWKVQFAERGVSTPYDANAYFPQYMARAEKQDAFSSYLSP